MTTFSASAQSPRAENSWLDSTLVNWNRQSSDFPHLPDPVTATNVEQCRESIREPESDAEQALSRRGWKLFGSVQNFGTTQLHNSDDISNARNPTANRTTQTTIT